jgi:O-antigen/teichoic acid export membrane protein
MLGKFRNFIYSAWGQILVAITVFISFRIYTEMLNPHDFGIIMMIMGLVALIDSVGLMTLNQTIVSRCGKILNNKHQKIISVSLAFIFIKKSLILFLVIFIISLFFFRDNLYILTFILLYFSYLVVESFKISQTSLLILNRKFNLYSLWIVVESISSLIAIYLFLHYMQDKVLAYLFGYFSSRLITSSFFAFLIQPKLFYLNNIKYINNDLKEIMKYSIPIAYMGPLGWLSNYIDRYILGIMLNYSSAGIYSATSGIVGKPYSLVTNLFSNYFKPSMFAENRIDKVKKTLFIWILIVFVFGFISTIFLYLFGEFIVNIILAKEYRVGVLDILILFSISQTFAIATHASDNFLLSRGLSLKLLKLQILMIFLIIFVPIGIYFYGLTGAILAKCIVELLKFIIVTSICLSHLKSEILEINLERE